MSWYVVQVLSGHEKKVKRTLEENLANAQVEDQIHEILLPTEQVSEVKRGEQKVVEKKLWPGYLLVRADLNDDSWMYIKNTNGVIDFLGKGKPVPLTEDEVKSLLSDLKDKKEQVTQKHNFKVGDKVKINDGVFVNFVGVVQEVHEARGRLCVLVSIFGRDTKVDDLEFWQVEEVSEEAETL